MLYGGFVYKPVFIFLAHRIMTGVFVGSFGRCTNVKRKQVYVMQYIPVVFLFCKQYNLHYPSIIEQFQSFHCTEGLHKSTYCHSKGA